MSLQELDLSPIDEIVSEFKQQDVQSVGVCHCCMLTEMRTTRLAICDRLADIAPEISVSLSSIVSAEMASTSEFHHRRGRLRTSDFQTICSASGQFLEDMGITRDLC